MCDVTLLLVLLSVHICILLVFAVNPVMVREHENKKVVGRGATPSVGGQPSSGTKKVLAYADKILRTVRGTSTPYFKCTAFACPRRRPSVGQLASG
jgi:hypothetical protein